MAFGSTIRPLLALVKIATSARNALKPVDLSRSQPARARVARTPAVGDAIDPREAQAWLTEALAAEGDALRLLLDGDPGAAEQLRAVAGLYRRSWETSPPGSYGRLVGMLKAAVLAGDASASARYAREALGGGCGSAVSCYALALAALVEGDDDAAADAAGGMRGETGAFARTADAIEALARGDADAYRAALGAIVADFESRDDFLTGVAIADTAAVLERLAAARGLAVGIDSELLPP